MKLSEAMETGIKDTKGLRADFIKRVGNQLKCCPIGAAILTVEKDALTLNQEFTPEEWTVYAMDLFPELENHVEYQFKSGSWQGYIEKGPLWNLIVRCNDNHKIRRVKILEIVKELGY